MIASAPSHLEWNYIVRELDECLSSLPAMTATCSREKSVAAAMELCELCRSTAGRVIDADHFIKDTTDIQSVIRLLEKARSSVRLAANTLGVSEKKLVRGYADNIEMRIQILKKFAAQDEEGAVKLMRDYEGLFFRRHLA